MTDDRYTKYLDNDPISRLYAQYFVQADVLFRYRQKFSQEREGKGRVSKIKEMDEFHIFKLWLASLWVVVDGFQTPPIQNALQQWKEVSLDIRVYCSSITYKVTQLGEELRLFRNATFHFQANPEKHLKFLQVRSRHQPIVWAEELHQEFAMLFKEYRVLHLSEYLLHGQSGQSSLS